MDEYRSTTEELENVIPGLGYLLEAALRTWEQEYPDTPMMFIAVTSLPGGDGSVVAPVGNFEPTPEALGNIADSLHDIARSRRRNT